jgi:hypothetical protein
VGFLVGRDAQLTAFPCIATIVAVSWEITFGVLWPPPGRSSRLMYRTWLLLDLGLIYQAFLWGGADVKPGWFQDHFGVLLAVGLAVAIGLHAWAFRRFGRPRLQAYAVNVVISLSFLHLLAIRPDGAGLSMLVGWLKLLGTGCISAANILSLRPSFRAHPRLLALFGTIAALDACYLFLL